MSILSAIASFIGAGIVFVIAAAGLLLALLVFLMIVLVFVLRRKSRQYAAMQNGNGAQGFSQNGFTWTNGGTRFFYYSSGGSGQREQMRDGNFTTSSGTSGTSSFGQTGDVYDLSPDEYTVDHVEEEKQEQHKLN